jgi:hypothetical protein
MCHKYHKILNLKGKMSVLVQNDYMQIINVNEHDGHDIFNPFSDNYSCICGKTIENEHYIQNKTNNIIYIIGSACIRQLFPENVELIKSISTTLCECCDKRYVNIKSHNKSKKHINLFKYGKTHRKCSYCKEYKIKLTSNKMYKYCYHCNIKNDKCSRCNDPITHRQWDLYTCCYNCTR